MSRKSPDLTGQKFHKLVAIREDGRNATNLLWLCACDCGRKTHATVAMLVHGTKKSCGCLKGAKRPPKYCTVTGCNKIHRAKGFCNNHYVQVSRPHLVASAPTLTAEWLRAAFDYDPSEGVLTYAEGTLRRKKGDRAGFLSKSTGYLYVVIKQRRYPIHRLVWLRAHGVWPEGDVDHINGVKTDNRLSNLREATRSLNMQNVWRSHADSETGLLGVWRRKDSSRKKQFIAQIMVGGKKKYIGAFHTPEEAHAAYLQEKAVLHAGAAR